MSVNQYDATNKILKLIAGGTLFADTPIGTINAYGGVTAPEGWMLCQGQAISRTEYADLFAVIGTSYGSGDGSTTFNLPDMREATLKGAGTTSKTVGAHNAINVGDFVDDRVQSHTHNSPGNIVLNGSQWQNGSGVLLSSVNAATTGQSGRYGDTTEVKAVGVNFIIKAKQFSMPANLLEKIEALLEDKNYITWSNT